jgi:hypothetical protein
MTRVDGWGLLFALVGSLDGLTHLVVAIIQRCHVCCTYISLNIHMNDYAEHNAPNGDEVASPALCSWSFDACSIQ